MRRPYRVNNFTLLEVVVAMSIMVLVALIIGTASAAFYNGYRRSVRITEQLKRYQAIDQLMDQNVRNLVPFKWRDELNASRFVFEGKIDSLHFTALRKVNAGGRGALLFIRLRVEEEQLIAEYSSYPRLPWEQEGAQIYTREVLADNVREVRFRYAEQGSDEIEFYDDWVEDDHASTPLAIQMTVEWLDGSKEQWLRRTAGSAANNTFGIRETSLSQ